MIINDDFNNESDIDMQTAVENYVSAVNRYQTIINDLEEMFIRGMRNESRIEAIYNSFEYANTLCNAYLRTHKELFKYVDFEEEDFEYIKGKINPDVMYDDYINKLSKMADDCLLTMSAFTHNSNSLVQFIKTIYY